MNYWRIYVNELVPYQRKDEPGGKSHAATSLRSEDHSLKGGVKTIRYNEDQGGLYAIIRAPLVSTGSLDTTFHCFRRLGTNAVAETMSYRGNPFYSRIKGQDGNIILSRNK